MSICKMFGEISTSELKDWREPSRVLEATIHHAYYPITKMVLDQVFDPFGTVEINVCELFDYIEAWVIFQSKLQAADAFGSLHGCSI
jgi:hypothetical protein